MLTLKNFMESVKYRITEGSPYGWQCYGNNAYCLDSWDGERDGHSATIIFDTETQVVYEVSVFDYKKERAYRIIHPSYVTAQKQEAENHSVPFDEAWDEVRYTDLDVDEDFLEKLIAIFNNEDYDDRVQIPLDLPKEELYELMRMAHEHDMTFNDFIVKVLQEQLELLEKGKNK